MKKKTTEEVISDFISVHGDKYDYSLVEYVNNKTKVKIMCKEHGVFEQGTIKHISGQGCKRCCTNTLLSTREIIERFIKVHGDTYNYSEVKYNGLKKDITIICHEHGKFVQSARSHLSGSKCRKCSTIQLNKHNTKTKTQIIEEFRRVHGNKYDYTDIKYTGIKNKVTIICKEHGEFTIVADYHKHGQGCSSCSKYGFDNNKPAILYYLSINNGEAYKIGITNRKIKDRYCKSDLMKIEVLKEWYFVNGIDAKRKEKKILTQFCSDLYTGEPLLNNGNSELFTHDILCVR